MTQIYQPKNYLGKDLLTKDEANKNFDDVNAKIDEHISQEDLHTNKEEKDSWSDKYTKAEIDEKLTHKTDVETTEALEKRVTVMENAIPEGQRVDVLNEKVEKLSEKVDTKADETELRGHVDNTGVHFEVGEKDTIKGDITKLKGDLESHTTNDEIHVDLAKKNAWDAKVDHSDIDSAIQTLHGEVTGEIEAKATELTGTFDSKVDEINESITELEQSKSSNDELNSKIGEVNTKLDEKASKEDLEKEKTSLTEKITSLETASATKVELEDKTSPLKQSIENLESTKATTEALNQAVSRIDQEKATKEELSQKEKELTDKLAEKATQAELTEKTQSLTESIDELKNSSATKEALESLTTEVSTKITKNELDAEVEKINADVAKKATEENLTQEVDKINTELAKKATEEKLNEEVGKINNEKATKEELTQAVEKIDREKATKEELSGLQDEINKRVIQELEGTTPGAKAKIQNQSDGGVMQYVGEDDSNSAVTVNDYSQNVGAEICSLDAQGHGARIILNHDGAYYYVGDEVKIEDDDKIATSKDLKDKVTQTDLTAKETELSGKIDTKTGEISTKVGEIETRVQSLEDVRPEDTYSDQSHHAQSGLAVAQGINDGLTKKVVTQPEDNLKELVLEITEEEQVEEDKYFANATINGTIYDFSGYLHTIKIKGPTDGKVGSALFLSVWQGTENNYNLLGKSLNASKCVPGGEMVWYFEPIHLESNLNLKLIPYVNDTELAFNGKYVNLHCTGIYRKSDDKVSWFDRATENAIAIASLNPDARIPHATFIILKESVGSVLQNDFSVKTVLKETTERLNALEAALANDSIAIGIGAKTESAQNSVAIGKNAKSGGLNSISIGSGSIATGTSEGAIAVGNTASGAKNAVAVGSKTSASVENGISLGYKANCSSSGVALGANSIVDAPNSIALGEKAQAHNITAVALGYNANSIGNSAVALGAGTEATGDFSVAVGYSAKAKEDSTVVLCTASRNDSTYTQLYLVAGGSDLSTRCCEGKAALAYTVDDRQGNIQKSGWIALEDLCTKEGFNPKIIDVEA